MNNHRKIQMPTLCRLLLSVIGKLLIVPLILWILFSFVYGLCIVKDYCMSPALHEGDLALYYRMQNTYTSGDVVAYSFDGHEFLGRIAAVSGDVVLITEEGQLVINGYMQVAENAMHTYPTEKSFEYPVIVGENEFFILCDNREETVDSRGFGLISIDSLEGKIITILRRRGI